jgi:hypothetical protein
MNEGKKQKEKDLNTYTSISCRNDAHHAWQTMKIGE